MKKKRRNTTYKAQMRRHRRWLAVACTLGIVLVVATAYVMIQRGGEPAATPAITRAGATQSLSSMPDPTGHPSEGEFPNADLTPGAVAYSNTAEICRPGYATDVRPNGSEWNRLKDEAYKRYGLARGHRSSTDEHGVRQPAYEVDHLIPLELGGSPSDIRNIWPEPIGYAKQKDKVENELHALVCSGRMPLDQAQSAIARNWETAVP
jgi:hypothetical protein